MNAPIKNSIAMLTPELTEWRRDFHRHPELLYECRRTAGIVADRLREFGFDEVHEASARLALSACCTGRAARR
jgi:hippurate hydrolase